MGNGGNDHIDESEPDPFEAVGREIASLLRATHESTVRIQADAEEQASKRLEQAEAQAAQREADAEQRNLESTRRLEEAAAMLHEAETLREQTRLEATQLLQGVLTLLDVADARSSRLVDDIEGTRTALAAVRTDLTAFGDTIAGSGATTTTTGTRPHLDPPPAVIDLRDEQAASGADHIDTATATAVTADAATAASEPHGADLAAKPPPPTGDSAPAPAPEVATDDTVDDRVAASVRSAVSRAIDQCLTDPPPSPSA